MKNFLVLYGANAKLLAEFNDLTPEQEKEEMEKWGIWMEKNAEHLVDPGNPTGKNTRLRMGGAVDHGNEVCGYTIIKAEDKEKALQILSDSPHMQNHEMYIELMEIIDMDM